MADKAAAAGDSLKTSQDAAPTTPKAVPKRNPAFRMMGLPNFRFRLPSRNWLIFLSITGSFASALLYDRLEKKRAQRKWCTLVSHLALEPLPVDRLQRKLTVYLSAPPGDGLRSAREYFQEYVKPVLVAAALDWEVVEGRREGDVRAGLAERIRRLRRKQGEAGEAAVEEDAEALIEQTRQRTGIRDYDGIRGDIVIGRHTWKEYIRGLHEGWLGPLDPPPAEPSTKSTTADSALLELPSTDTTFPPPEDPQPAHDGSSPTSPPSRNPTADDQAAETDRAKEPENPKPKPTTPTPPYIPTTVYPTSPLAPTIPTTFSPSTPLPLPHILGFLNTPTRIYRFLTRRHLADNIGRETAAVVLAAHRPYHQTSSFASSIDPDSDSPSPIATAAPTTGPPLDAETVVESGTVYEQQTALQHEEREWHKSARKRNEGEGERVWLDGVVLDPRVAERMRRFELAAVEEERAGRIAEGEEGVLGQEFVRKGELSVEGTA